MDPSLISWWCYYNFCFAITPTPKWAQACRGTVTGLFTVFHMFSMWLIYLKKSEGSPCLCSTTLKNRGSLLEGGIKGMLLLWEQLYLFHSALILYYVSCEIPKMNRKVAASRHQSKSQILELVKPLRIKISGLLGFGLVLSSAFSLFVFFVWFGVFLGGGFFFVFLRDCVATWETTKITGIVLPLWGCNGQSINVFQSFYHSKSTRKVHLQQFFYLCCKHN